MFRSRGGRGRGGGRGGFGAGNPPPMGLSFADIQAISREATEMYPTRELPVLTEFSAEEKKISQLQTGFATRLRASPYYIVEVTKSTDLARYSDKYRTLSTSQPLLRKKDLHQPFFPTEIFENYFNPRHKYKGRIPVFLQLKHTLKASIVNKKGSSSKKMDLDEMLGDEEEEKSGDERSDQGSQGPDEDYDVDEEYDNDYAENYFDNGEGDDMDDLGDGGGGDGGGDYD